MNVVCDECIDTPVQRERPKCDFCDKPAIVNEQECWVQWNITENGDYVLDLEKMENHGENYHLCEDHYWENQWGGKE